jgi:K+/H+ antiporter YhaU regulatory subunit KhtT
MDLRSHTGASVIGVTFPSGEAGVPTGRETLLAGYVLVLAGTRDAVDAARRLLREGAPGPEEDAPA